MKGQYVHAGQAAVLPAGQQVQQVRPPGVPPAAPQAPALGILGQPSASGLSGEIKRLFLALAECEDRGQDCPRVPCAPFDKPIRPVIN